VTGEIINRPDVQTSVDLLWAGQVPTADLIGEVFSLEHVGEALDVLDRKLPGRDPIRVCWSLFGSLSQAASMPPMSGGRTRELRSGWA
jgi:hypothetical protein